MADAKRLTFFDIIRSKKLLIILLMGYASGLPFPLTHGTLQAWIKQSGVSLEELGYLSTAIAYPYALKFIWAPFLDRYLPPFLGLRKGWLIITQVILMMLFVAIGFTSPSGSLNAFVFTAILISFFSASQDIIVDAYRVEILDEAERGFAMPPAILGYRIALIVAASLALVWADEYSWQTVYLFMAGFMSIGLFTTIFCEEPAFHREPKKNLKEVIILPFKDFLTRPYAFEILAFVLLYKFGEILATSLTTPFMMDIGFSLKEIGIVTKGVGLAATIIGATIGGVIMLRMDLYKSLWLFGFIQSISTLSYLALAEIGKNSWMMGTAIGLENFCLGMATSAFTAFLMNICNTKYTGTQYALLTSILALVNTNATALAGKLVKNMGWSNFFIFCIIATLPGLLLLFRFKRWNSIQ
jgi:PAT family beta-lactamase induction signal transducer AmpG